MSPPAFPGVARAVETGHAPDYAQLEELLDMQLLVSLGWDADTAVFSVPAEHATLIWFRCSECGLESSWRDRACASCQSNGRYRTTGELCLVCRTPGHERPARRSGLCHACAQYAGNLGLSVDEYLHSPHATPRPSFGRCRVAACDGWAFRRGLCPPHHNTWQRDGKPNLDEWCRWAKPAEYVRPGKMHFAGLPAVVRDEVLFGIQTVHRRGYRWHVSDIRGVLDMIRRQQASCLADLRLQRRGRYPHVRRFVAMTLDAVLVAFGDRETEVTKDVWDLRLWGLSAFLRFDGSAQPTRRDHTPHPAISQPWLRETAKRVAAKYLGRDRSSGEAQRLVSACGLWSRWLERREDRGRVPSALRRADVTNFVVHLSIRERNGEISKRFVADQAGALRRFLQQVREDQLAERTGPCAGLPAEVTLARHEVPKQWGLESDDEVGEALPAAVTQQLLAPEALALLSAAGERRIRIALEVGRRPSELLNLRYDCLEYDDSLDPATGGVTRLPVLVHDMPKVRRMGYRLPIVKATADLIVEQQHAVRERFPDLATEKLLLWPAFLRNAHGARAMTARSWALELRLWLHQVQLVDGELTADGSVIPRLGHDGQPVPFPAERVHPYAFRHTFAQRHIDAGTPVQTLQDLMGHANIKTTMGYYRIKMDKRREAIEKLGALQLTAFGLRVAPVQATASVTARYEVGQVAVPFGTCVEPSNVRAHGQACQFRHRCFGCAHFRTDPSYLPELRAYLSEMLLAKERLTTALPELADWARAQALPQDEEIATVRRLIAACEQALEQLSGDDRRATEEAIAVLRAARVHLDATFPVQFRSLVMQPMPSVFPVLLRSPDMQVAQPGVA